MPAVVRSDARCRACASWIWACLEQRPLDGLTAEEESWRKALVDGTEDGRIPDGESMEELGDAHACRAQCLSRCCRREAVRCW